MGGGQEVQSSAVVDKRGSLMIVSGCWFVGGDDLTGALHDL